MTKAAGVVRDKKVRNICSHPYLITYLFTDVSLNFTYPIHLPLYSLSSLPHNTSTLAVFFSLLCRYFLSLMPASKPVRPPYSFHQYTTLLRLGYVSDPTITLHCLRTISGGVARIPIHVTSDVTDV